VEMEIQLSKTIQSRFNKLVNLSLQKLKTWGVDHQSKDP